MLFQNEAATFQAILFKAAVIIDLIFNSSRINWD